MSLKKKFTKYDSNISQVFTPDFIADFMVRNSVRFLEKRSVKVLEPCAGEGAFLTSLLQQGFQDITAYELDLNLKPILIHNFPSIKFKFENFLSANKDEKFDLIIGNPPYLGQNYHADIFQEYIDKYPICAEFFVGNMDLFYFFIHQGIYKLNPGGILSFITTNYWITKSEKTGIKFLKPHIIDECYLLQYIDIAKLRIFKDAQGQHNCIFILRKKTDREKTEKINKDIEILQLKNGLLSKSFDNGSKHSVFNNLLAGTFTDCARKYTSSLTNNDLSRNGSWNLLYPIEISSIISSFEKYCMKKGHKSTLKDYFMVRNGLILIKDEIFILKEGESIKIEDNDFLIKVYGKFLKINDIEKTRLKKIYKSKSILPYGIKKDDYLGYLIYFNKSDLRESNIKYQNEILENNYPVLTSYLKQFENNLRSILINANENPEDFYFPRRGAFIRKEYKNKNGELIDLEPYYDFGKKIFFKYISDENEFGFTPNSYYATSDTYFLWPKIPVTEINFLFLLAYLNSKLVKFIYQAKNIKIKRSKTKLEYELPIPNLNKFHSQSQISIIKIIEFLSSYIIKTLQFQNDIKVTELEESLKHAEYFQKYEDEHLKTILLNSIKSQDILMVKKIIDHLFFNLFEIDENSIDDLIKKFYA